MLTYKYVEDIYYKRIPYMNNHLDLIKKFEK